MAVKVPAGFKVRHEADDGVAALALRKARKDAEA